MKISAVEEYGLRCLQKLARQPEAKPLTVAEIAAREGLTVPYAGKLMAILRQAGLVESVRGPGGGYVLARPAAEITVMEVLGALGEPLFGSDYCDTHAGSRDTCSNQVDCSIRSVWQTLGDIIRRVLGQTTLADLCLREAQMASHLEVRSRDAALLSLPTTPRPPEGGAPPSAADRGAA